VAGQIDTSAAFNRLGRAVISSGGVQLCIFAVAMWSWAPPCAIGAEGSQTRAPTNVSRLSLDGRSFRIEAFEKGEKVFEDRLVFKDGTFFSEACRKFGFDRSPYYTRVEGDHIQFLAETVSPTHGTMVWKGSVKQNRIDGGFRWTKERWYWTIRRHFDVTGAVER